MRRSNAAALRPADENSSRSSMSLELDCSIGSPRCRPNRMIPQDGDGGYHGGIRLPMAQSLAMHLVRRKVTGAVRGRRGSSRILVGGLAGSLATAGWTGRVEAHRRPVHRDSSYLSQWSYATICTVDMYLCI